MKVLDGRGKFLALVAGPKQFAEGTVGLDLAVDSRGRILVLDPVEGEIRIYAELSANESKEKK
ncbi:MAG: hypothetical protein ACYTHM_24670 [Planctomycetota bacterium]